LGKRKATLELQVEYEVKVFDPKTGKVIKRVKGKAKSFTRHFSRILAIMIFSKGDGYVSVPVTDRDGYGRTMISPETTYSPTTYDPAGAHAFQLGVGRSDLAFDRDQYNLIDGVGWVPYSTFSITDDGTKVIFEVSGSWYNDTGALVTIKEIAMFSRFRDIGGYMYWIMLARDVITPTDVPAGSTIAVAYKATIPF